jgi:predicted enzyme related to lactoylglutathione lyase
MGLYATFFLHWLGLVTGMLGLVMVMFHGSLGYEVSIQLGLIPPGIVTTTSSNIIIAVINAFAWGTIYGVIGYFIDKYRKHRQNPNKALVRDAGENPPAPHSVFGWSFQDFGPEYSAFSNQGIDGGFFKSDLSSSTSNGAALIVFYSNDLEATQEKVKTANGIIVKPIFPFPGGRRFHFTEPGGNEFAVWSDKNA